MTEVSPCTELIYFFTTYSGAVLLIACFPTIFSNRLSRDIKHGCCNLDANALHIPPRPLLDLEVVTIKTEGCVFTLGP